MGKKSAKCARTGQAQLVDLHRGEIKLNVLVDYSDKTRRWQIRGIVGVPSRPANDAERYHLARMLIGRSDAPRKNIRKFVILDWSFNHGEKHSVTVQKCREIPAITCDQILDLRVVERPDTVDKPSSITIDDSFYAEWNSEYQSNRYLRFETRSELNQRLQDIWGNLLVLHNSGKVDLTTNTVWHRLFQHVAEEMRIRGEPPHQGNLDPSIEPVDPLRDKDLCERAVMSISGKSIMKEVLVKYGRLEDMERLYRHGLVWINPASTYDKPQHNQAVRDNERRLMFKGGFATRGAPRKFLDKQSGPSNFNVHSTLDFVRIFDAPELAMDEYASVGINLETDYWSYCLAGKLSPRLFSDFGSTACVTVERKPFIQRVYARMQETKKDTSFDCGFINYEDPVGAYVSSVVDLNWMPVHMTKSLRYAYQHEFRLVWKPIPYRDKLEPIAVEIGCLEDIAELILI